MHVYADTDSSVIKPQHWRCCAVSLIGAAIWRGWFVLCLECCCAKIFKKTPPPAPATASDKLGASPGLRAPHAASTMCMDAAPRSAKHLLPHCILSLFVLISHTTQVCLRLVRFNSLSKLASS